MSTNNSVLDDGTTDNESFLLTFLPARWRNWPSRWSSSGCISTPSRRRRKRSVRQEGEDGGGDGLLRARHKVEVEKLVGERAMAQADSRMGRLNSQVQSQQVGLMMVMINDDD